MLDAVAYDVERQHRHGAATRLNDQTRLAVDRVLQERYAGNRTSPAGEEARDRFSALDRAEFG